MMTEPQFVHLRVHSEYPIKDDIVRINEAVARYHEMAMPALAITGLANKFATIKFCQATCQNGIKQIIGLDT